MDKPGNCKERVPRGRSGYVKNEHGYWKPNTLFLFVCLFFNLNAISQHIDILLRTYISREEGDQTWMVGDVGLRECLFCLGWEYLDFV